MAKEIARFQLTSGSNNLERWMIPDNINVITENTDSTHYSEAYQHQFYNSAIINFDTSVYGYLWASSMLLFDASCQITVERSTDGGSTWSSYRTVRFQTLNHSFYTSGGGDSGIGGTYWINLNANNAQCISSVLPIYTNATDFNNAVTNVYVPSTWEVVTNLGGYTCSVLTGYTSPEDVPFQINDDVLVLGNTPSALTGAGSSEWVINQYLKVLIALTSTGLKNDGSLHMPADSGTSIAGWAGLAYMGSKADFVFFINEATEEGDAFFASYVSQVDAVICNYRVNQLYRHDLYLALKNSMPTAYNWTPLESITGKLGTFDLSQIGTINYGNPVSGATIDDIAEIEPSTELSTLAEGCDVKTPIIYSDKFNYISIKDNGDDTCNLKFYYRGSPIYSLMGISQNAYLSMLIDSENEVLKPSIIYSTDATHYSYNQETPTDDEMLALYRWLTANAQLEEFEAYRYHDENGVEVVLEDKGDTETGFYEEVSYVKV